MFFIHKIEILISRGNLILRKLILQIIVLFIHRYLENKKKNLIKKILWC